jgi:hypothetical protein
LFFSSRAAVFALEEDRISLLGRSNRFSRMIKGMLSIPAFCFYGR